jgi:uncharacterized SAM-binding protein YcdF (DUF218 family)
MIKLVLRVITVLAIAWCAGLFFYVANVLSQDLCDNTAEGAVVLTGDDKRVDKGFDLLARGKVKRLLISGVNSDVRKSELLALSHQNASLADSIDLGFSAQDTMGNADEAAQWVHKNDIASLIVVTSTYHMPRAIIHLGSQLPNVSLYSCAVRPDLFDQESWYTQWAPWRLLLTDYTKFLLTYPQILLLKYT